MKTSRETFLSALIISFPLGLFAQKTDTRPNMLIIMADDLDSRQISCYGGQNIKTPNIDLLATKGVQFHNLYCSEAMCVPIRASLFTGLYPARNGAFQNHKVVYPGTKTIGKYLADLGYTVALTGKDHCTKPDSIYHFRLIPGFETSCTAITANYNTDSIQAFMTSIQHPFCMFVMSTNPHAPWTVGNPAEFDPNKLVLPPHWVDTKDSRKEFCKYLAEVRALDNQVGDVVRALIASGKDKNTLIIFLGEQGPQLPAGKWTLYDYGVKSAFLAVLPDVIKNNTISNAMIQYEDIAPTLVDLAGGKPIEKLDGKSFLSALMGKTNIHRDYVYGIHNNIPEGSAYPIRSIRNTKYKLVYNLMSDSSYYLKYYMNPQSPSIVWKSWLDEAKTNPIAKKMVNRVVKHPEYEFYDMEKDPYELNNLIDISEYKTTVEKLKSNLNKWMVQQNDQGKSFDQENIRIGLDSRKLK